MNRRQFLGSTTMSVSLIAGCTGSNQEDQGKEIKDSDGDGVIDSEDYAPQDSDVQEKSDLKSTTQTTTTTKKSVPTTTTTTSAATTTTTTTTSTTTTVSANTLEVTDEYWKGQSHISAYSSEEVRAVIYDDHQISADELKVVAAMYEFPRGSRITYGESDVFENPSGGSTEVTVPIDTTSFPTNQRLEYSLFVLPSGIAWDEATSGDVDHITDTDPFVVERDNVTISRSPHPDSLESASEDTFTRNPVEGAYDLVFQGRTDGVEWEISFFTFKSAYVQTVNKSRGRSYDEYVTYELTSGSAPGLASILDVEAEENGFTGKREKVEFVIDFVQSLPYVPDDVSKGYDDYSKFILETITEAGGDCEDTSILLASILEAEPFGYDMVLLAPEGHMAVGIKGSDDLPGYYWEYDGNKYYYIETTGTGWGIGDVPEEYDRAKVYQV